MLAAQDQSLFTRNYQANILHNGPDPKCEGQVEGEVAFFSAKRWDRRNRADLIESATPCHDAQEVGLYRDSNPLRLTILAAMSEDYTTAPQHLQCRFCEDKVKIIDHLVSDCSILTPNEYKKSPQQSRPIPALEDMQALLY